MKQELIREYAKLAIQVGVNLQKGQDLVINTSIDAVDITRMVVEEAYLTGARQVIVNWGDDVISRMHYDYMDTQTLCEIPDYAVEQKVDPLRKGAAVLHLSSDIPGIMSGVDTIKMAECMKARQLAFKESSEMTMANKVQWCIVRVPNVEWAKKVFPDKEDDEALELLWEAVLKSVHITGDGEAIEKWREHNKKLQSYVRKLNEYRFDTLHFQNEAGTDLTIQLMENHIWAGGSEESVNGVVFNPNMPTEEVFCMPYKYGVNGKVVSTKPLHYNGVIIPSFELVFKDGKVISHKATENEDILTSLLDFDDGSRYLGEVALVPYDSPISLSNVLFYDTLYDENASCHLALGRAYPMNVEHGVSMSQEELDKIGSNDSMTHVDFMFGSRDMRIVGTTKSGEQITIFENGNFVI